jgi:uncharacterized protein
MQSTQNTEIFDASLALISTNMEAWSNLLAEDATMEIPYAGATILTLRLRSMPSVVSQGLKS